MKPLPPPDAPIYRTRQRWPKWSGVVLPTHVPAMLRQRFATLGWTNADHVSTARHWLTAGRDMERQWNEEVRMAVRRWGDHGASPPSGEGWGALISGVYRDHFPARVKERLRGLAHGGSWLIELSYAHWRAAGKAGHTWPGRGGAG